MAKQSKSKKQNNTGKGRVTPVQIAFIVDRYFADNNFTQTRSTFRSEASSLISKTNVQEAPKSLMSLDAILDEYISLKEQKMFVEEEKVRAAEMKARSENLVMAMQNLMNAFTNSSRSNTPPSISNLGSLDLAPRPSPSLVSPPGYTPYPVFNLNSVPLPQSSNMGVANYTTPSANAPTPSTSAPTQNKRKSSRSVPDAPTVSKRSRRHPVTQTPSSRRHPVTQTPSSPDRKIPLQSKTMNCAGLAAKQEASTIESSQSNIAVSSNGVGSSVRESSVAKNLFKQSSPTLQSNSPSPKTPPQDCICQVDNTVSPLETSCLVHTTCDYTPQDNTPSNCAVITSTETVMVSLSKHVTYSVERSHYYSSSPAKAHLKRQGTRDHVKGRLDFGVSDAPMSSDQTTSPDDPASGDDLFDDMPNFDMFGPDFSLSEFLVDMDINCGQGTDPASHTLSGSTHEQGLGNSEANQTFSELQSSVTEILCEKDMHITGPDSLLLIVFTKIGDVKALGRCCVVSRRFHGLVPQIDNVVVKIDCITSNEDSAASLSSTAAPPPWPPPTSNAASSLSIQLLLPLRSAHQFLILMPCPTQLASWTDQCSPPQEIDPPTCFLAPLSTPPLFSSNLSCKTQNSCVRIRLFCLLVFWKSPILEKSVS